MTTSREAYSLGRPEDVLAAYQVLHEAMGDCFIAAMESGQRDVADAINNWRAAFTITGELVLGSSGIAGMPPVDSDLRAAFRSVLANYLRWTDEASTHAPPETTQ